MANRLKMARINGLEQLLENGWSQRRIARELGINRETVSRYARKWREKKSKPAIVTTGSEQGPAAKPAKVTAGSEAGRRSHCEPHRKKIKSKLVQGLSAQRIFQDLVTDENFSHSYESVKRFARRLESVTPLPFRRMECLPGEEAQIDFGQGAPTDRPGKRRRRPHLFRMVLSYSRKGYSESVWTQSAEDFIRSIENGFRAWGGVPTTIVVDNLKAAVLQPDWYDPEINPKFDAFCRHYGVIVLPTKSYTPRHKGKVEAGVKYSQDNALKGRVFESLAAQNDYLRTWEANTADLRIHGTIRRQVKQVFLEEEKAKLGPLPAQPFPFFHEGSRKVHRDGHVSIEQAFYSVPPEYLGQEVWVRWDSHLIRVFNHKFIQISLHVKKAPGSFSTQDAHIHPAKISGIERGTADLLRRATLMGEDIGHWAQGCVDQRGIQGIRTLQGLLVLANHHAVDEINKVCHIAHTHQAFRLKILRQLLKQADSKPQMQFFESHPLIRDTREYGAFIHDVFQEHAKSNPTSPSKPAPNK